MSENNLIENGIYSFVDKNCEYYMVLIEKTNSLLIFLKIINDKIFKREDILTSIKNDGRNEFFIWIYGKNFKISSRKIIARI